MQYIKHTPNNILKIFLCCSHQKMKRWETSLVQLSYRNDEIYFTIAPTSPFWQCKTKNLHGKSCITTKLTLCWGANIPHTQTHSSPVWKEIINNIASRGQSILGDVPWGVERHIPACPGLWLARNGYPRSNLIVHLTVSWHHYWKAFRCCT